MGKYFSKWREEEKHLNDIENVLKKSNEKAVENTDIKSIDDQLVHLEKGFIFAVCTEEDIYEISMLYKRVFKTYPFPIDDPQYIKSTMNNNVEYYCIKQNNKIISMASCEMYRSDRNVEMTDFATHPDYRGKAFALYLLSRMQGEMAEDGFSVAYTIARALSYGMNITFAKAGYKYGGTLRNNTNISGSFESMNVWYKQL